MAHRRTFLGTLVAAAVAATAVLAPGAAASASVVSPAGLRAAMRTVVDAGASGVLAVVDDGDDVTRLAVGAAQLDPRQELRAGDQSRVGSITKTYMATIALQLVGEGRLQLTDTLEHWLPGLVPNGSAITLRMLLNHTSGIFNYTEDIPFATQLLADPYRYWTPQELVAVATAHPATFAPGTGWSYSNTGYVLVGLILQKASGQPIPALVQRRITGPLHLTSTFFATSADFRGHYAHGYGPPSLTGAGYLDTSSWPPSWAWTAGAMVSTAPDLVRFYQGLLSGRLLPPTLLRTMLTTVDAGVVRYGLGIYSLSTPCGVVWGHDGSIPGYTSVAYSNRQGTRSAVVLMPTQPDDVIAPAFEAVVLQAVCAMVDRPVPVITGSASEPTLARWTPVAAGS